VPLCPQTPGSRVGFDGGSIFGGGVSGPAPGLLPLYVVQNGTIDPVSAREPSSIALLTVAVVGLLGFGLARRKVYKAQGTLRGCASPL
jgi:hypothetical protein